jgi:hypothetical protein
MRRRYAHSGTSLGKGGLASLVGVALLSGARHAAAQEAAPVTDTAARPAVLPAAPARALTLTPQPTWLEATAGSEAEAYLRLLSLVPTRGAPAMAGARAWSPIDIARIVARAPESPWGTRYATPPMGRQPRFAVLRPAARMVWNSGIPFGYDDGPVWAGKGLTSVAAVGAAGALGPLSFRLEPLVFRAENNGFPLADNGLGGDARFGYIRPVGVDRPRRFGPGAYQRADLGNSEVRLSVLGLAAGVTTASEAWGPASIHPLILGANGGGFPRVFVGTDRALDLRVGRLVGRVVAGRLSQSAYSETPDSLATRLGSGIVVSFAPGGPFTGLEVGGTRFFHRPWAGTGAGWNGSLGRALRLPFEGLLFKRGQFDVDSPESPAYVIENQLGSVFARWAFPQGFEVYGEYGRDDAAVDSRDLLAQPEHDVAWMLGAQHLVRHAPQRWSVWRIEAVNGLMGPITRVRPQVPFGTHGTLRQGHSHRGQMLGTPFTLGGGGVTFVLDRYAPGGSTRWTFDRMIVAGPRSGESLEGAATPRGWDVQHALRYRRTRFRGGVDLSLEGGIVVEQNRDFRSNTASIVASVDVRWGTLQQQVAGAGTNR